MAVEGLSNQSGDDDQSEMGGDQEAPLPPNPHNIPDEPSTITLEEAQLFYDRYDITQDIEIHVPTENERFYAPPAGHLGVHVAAFEHGFHVPLDPELLAMFNHWEISPTQLAPNGVGYLVALLIFLRARGLPLSPENFYLFFSLSKVAHNPGFFYLNQREEFRIFRTLTSSNGRGWKSRWVWVRYAADEHGVRRGWGIVEQWRVSMIKTPPQFLQDDLIPEWVKRYRHSQVPSEHRMYLYDLLIQPLMYLARYTHRPVYCAGCFDLGRSHSTSNPGRLRPAFLMLVLSFFRIF